MKNGSVKGWWMGGGGGVGEGIDRKWREATNKVNEKLSTGK